MKNDQRSTMRTASSEAQSVYKSFNHPSKTIHHKQRTDMNKSSVTASSISHHASGSHLTMTFEIGRRALTTTVAPDMAGIENTIRIPHWDRLGDPRNEIRHGEELK